MKISKRERTAVGIFMLAAAALAVDKLLLPATEPETAEAVESPARIAAAPDLAAALRPDAPLEAPPTEIADVLAWSRLNLTAAPPPVDSQTPVAIDFEAKYRLDGVVLGPRPAAIISGRVLTTGESLDGFRLATIQGDRVTFVLDGQSITLGLHRPNQHR